MRLPFICLAILTGATISVNGQEENDLSCACSPSQYEFIFDLTSNCSPINITLNDGVPATSCFVSALDGHTVEEPSDLVPVRISSIAFFEVDQKLRLKIRQNFVGPFIQGDRLTYDSIERSGTGRKSAAATKNSQSSRSSSRRTTESSSPHIPKALQVNIFGINEQGQDLVNVFLISFSNDCSVYPTLFEGQSAGWLVLGQLEDPPQELCPAAPARLPTLSPSESLRPTHEPTSRNPNNPSLRPSPYRSSQPSTPSQIPTLSPVTQMPTGEFSLSLSMQQNGEFDLLGDEWGDFGLGAE